jgi:hypothetical protein
MSEREWRFYVQGMLGFVHACFLLESIAYVIFVYTKNTILVQNKVQHFPR